MLPSWLWTVLLFAIVLPFHYFVVAPVTEDFTLLPKVMMGLGYFSFALIWSIVGDRLRIVRR